MKPVKKNFNDLPLPELISRAQIIAEALPYINAFRGATIVIKYGGHAMIDEDLKRSVIQDIVLMELVGMNPVVVHGGGPEISDLMNKLGVKPQFVEGQRVTDAATLEVAEMVLAGKLCGEIVNRINQTGGRAVGLSGKDAALILARKLRSSDKGGANKVDIGFVGEVAQINPEIVSLLTGNQFIPVISPIGVDENGQTYNINADSVAAEVAGALKASKLIFLTDVKGIYKDAKDEKTHLSTIGSQDVEKMISDGVIVGGMIPKARGCRNALDAGVAKTHILDGRIPHSLLLEIFTDRGIGTQIV
ncbi:acetylglutamate kinase [Candidatus Sumerlaeota bacterium]|nr:acetylglutamate kinase [Candidatus Sumerlaeota bacterium]